MPCWARSRLTQRRSSGTRSVGCSAWSSCSLVQGRTVRSKVGSPASRSATRSPSARVAQRTWRRLRDGYRFERRGPIQVKGKGTLVTWFLVGRNGRAG